MRKNVCIIMAIASLIFFSHFISASEEIYYYHNDPFGYPVARANEREGTGLIFDGSRYYDPEIGRYLTPARESMVYNPYVPKPNEHMKYNSPIPKQIRGITKTRSRRQRLITNDQISWLTPENQFQLRELNQNNHRFYIIEILYPISKFENNRRKNADRFHGLF